MSDRNEKYRAKFLESLRGHVDGEPRAVGIFMRPGAYGAMALMNVCSYPIVQPGTHQWLM